MSSSIIPTAQVAPLPIGSGGSNTTHQQMNSINQSLAMMSVQSTADAKFDPPVPKPVTSQKLVQAFCSGGSAQMDTPQLSRVSRVLFVAGILCIVYGIVTK
jgi:hypothetical protein